MYVHAPALHVAVPDWEAAPVTDTLIVVESPDNEPHESPADVTFTFVENGNDCVTVFTFVTDTTGAVVSTTTDALFELSTPTQLVPSFGVSVYCQLPSGTVDSTQVRVVVPEQDADTVTGEPPAVG